jgi:hypothetical protein
LNSLPLAAVPNYGEVTGLGDGLGVWFGTDFDRINGLLYPPKSIFEGDQLAARVAHRSAQEIFLLKRIMTRCRMTIFIQRDIY